MRSKLITAGFVFLFAFLMFQSNLYADVDGGWATCEVERVGQGVGVGYIWLTRTDNEWADIRFKFNPDANNQLLATALTAISLGNNVRVYIEDDPTSAFQMIRNVYILK